MHESLTELETELCRLPGVIVTRFVGGSGGRPLGATIFVAAGATGDRIRASVQTIASVHFDIDIDPSRMVLIEVGETSIILPESSAPPPPTTVRGVPEPVAAEPTTVNAPTDEPPDSQQALASAQAAVHDLLGVLTSPEPERPDQKAHTDQKSNHADTIVVGNSDTADAGPANN